ncbi:MAG TPA: hypothetical protein VGQ76_02945 [Thermoanaerobaculia bacterium]|jgi:hypothetical protein|nr:hypothetical protein [Thermoanaerobaculia bacterium]
MSLRAARITLFLYLLAIYATLGIVRDATNFLRDRGLLRVSVVVAFAIAAVAFLWLIFRDARNRTKRVVLSLILVCAAYAVVIYPMKSAEEKIHFIEYGGVALLAYLAAPPAWSKAKRPSRARCSWPPRAGSMKAFRLCCHRATTICATSDSTPPRD